MTINKLIIPALSGLTGGYAMGFIAGFSKLASLGKSSWVGDAQIFGIPVMHIQANSSGFVASTRYGVFVTALIGGVLAVTIASVKNSANPS